MLNLTVDIPDLGGVVTELGATHAQVQKALNSTLGKMAAWLRVRSLKDLSEELLIQQKTMRRRLKLFRLNRNASGSEVTVWYGLDPIALIYLRAKKSSGGVKAEGGRFVKSGFIANGKNGGRQVFKRAGKERLPLEKQSADISDKASVFIEDNLLGTAEFETQFFKVFERELKWRTRPQ